MSKNKESIFVDEAGDPGLSSRSKPFFVLGFVYCKDPSELRKRLRRYLKRLHLKNKYPPHLSELKFNLPYSDLIQQGYTVNDLDDNYSKHMPLIRTQSLELIHKHCEGVFAAILNKSSIKKKWDKDELGNFIFAQTVIVNIMNSISPPNPPIIYYDDGRLSTAKSIKFKTYLVEKDSYFHYRGLKLYRGNLSTPVDTSSKMDAGIWAADLVAGSFYHKHQNKEWAYSNILNSKKIGTGERIFWD